MWNSIIIVVLSTRSSFTTVASVEVARSNLQTDSSIESSLALMREQLILDLRLLLL